MARRIGAGGPFLQRPLLGPSQFTDVPRGPIFVTPDRKRPVCTDPLPNLLLFTLAAVLAQPPFGAGNSLTPTARIVPVRTQDFIAPNLLVLGIPPASQPFIGEELQCSPKAAPLQVLDPPNLLTTTLRVQAQPFITQELQDPPRPARLQIQDPPNLLTSTFTVRPPFVQNEWPRTLRIADGSGQITQYVLFLPSLAQPPFAQGDWAAPLRAAPPIPTIDPPQLLLSTLIPPVIAFPFANFDWPNAPTPLQPRDWNHWVNSQIPDTIPPLVPPAVIPQDVGHSIELTARQIEHALMRSAEPFANPEITPLTERVTAKLVSDETVAPLTITVRYDVEIAAILWMLS